MKTVKGSELIKWANLQPTLQMTINFYESRLEGKRVIDEAELREILHAYDRLEPEKDDIYKFIEEILGE